MAKTFTFEEEKRKGKSFSFEEATSPPIPEPVNPNPAPERASEIGFFNRGIASVLGIPADLSKFVSDLVGITSPEERVFGGRESIEAMFRAGGKAIGENPRHMAPLPSERAETFGEMAMQGAGAGAVPIGAAGSLVRGTGAVARSLADIGATAVSRPILTAAVETVAGAGSGVGEFVGYKLDPESDLSRTLGAIIGGFGLPLLVSVAPVTGKLAYRGAKAGLAPFTKAGAKVRAQRRLQTLAGGEAGVEAAGRELTAADVLSGARLTPAQKTGNRRLLALEREVVKANHKLADKFRAQFEEAHNAVVATMKGLGGGGSAKKTRAFFAKQRDYTLSLVRHRFEQAKAIAEQRIAKLGPGAKKEDVARIVRQEIDDALAGARAQERQVWGLIPKETTVRWTATRDAYIDIWQARRKATDPEDIPQFVRKIFGKVKMEGGEEGLTPRPVLKKGKWKPQERVGELTTMRSRILREIRAERAKDAPNREKLANLEKLQEAILKDLNALKDEVSGEVGETVRNAIDFSNQLNAKFTKGPVGRLLGYERRGGPAVHEDLTLEAVARGNTKAGVEVDALINAGASRDQLEEFMRGWFALQATENGQIMPKKAAQFLNKYSAVLERFPQLREQMESARGAQRIADRWASRLAKVEKITRNRQSSRLALYLEAPPEQEITAILASKDPAGNMRGLVRRAKQDATGDALAGLKTSFSDYLIAKASTGQFTEAGEPILSGAKLMASLRNPAVRNAMKELYSPEEIDRLRQIVVTLERLDRASGPLPNIGGIIHDTPNTILEYAARVVGARAGAKAGEGTSGAGLLTAGMASQRIKRFLGNLTNDRAAMLLTDAVQDEAVFRAITQPITSFKAQEQAAKRLNTWLIGLGDRELTEEEGLRVTVPRQNPNTPSSLDFQRSGVSVQ